MGDVQQSRVFSKAKARAEEYLNDPDKLYSLARNATAKATALGQDGPLLRIWEDLNVMFRLVRHLCLGTYKRFPVRSLVLVVAGLLYFVWPLDLVPDAIPMLGWLDDVTLLAFIIRSIKPDLEAFRHWEKSESGDDTDQIVCLD
ncbi:MAG TPA: YkvA family protein [Pirellulaceae bacterium]|jgi:uncharacterized membrane protein YkvA (DUF1232 family)|nr:YkvA family protein [Pirellulaceae bacterium]